MKRAKITYATADKKAIFITLSCKFTRSCIGDIMSMNGVPNVTILPSNLLALGTAMIFGSASSTIFPP